jgi:hypothetical protein
VNDRLLAFQTVRHAIYRYGEAECGACNGKVYVPCGRKNGEMTFISSSSKISESALICSKIPVVILITVTI